jgi:hypothetical protein
MATVNTYTSDTTVSIPANAYDVQITVRSASGGRGGFWTRSPSNVGLGGAGRTGTFRFNTSFVARTLQIRIGQPGANGPTSFPGGNQQLPRVCGGSSSVGSGGCGGTGVVLSGTVYWAPGGSGGGATGVLIGGSAVAIAGGGGGGAGVKFYDSPNIVCSRSDGGASQNWAANSGAVSFSNGQDASLDANRDSAGGGGGGSSGGAAGGTTSSPNCPTPSQGGGSRYNSNELTLLSSSSHTGSPSITVSYETSFVDITSFTANPNPQTSGSDGIPNYNTTLSWTVNSAIPSLTYTVTSGSFSTSGNTNASGNVTITNLPQSTAGSNSPATRTYTLTVSDGQTSDTATITVSAFNDNVPNNYTLPNQSNLEPNTITTTSTNISGIDMSTLTTAGPGVQVSNNGTNWSSTTLITNGQVIFARATSPPFNTNPSGLTNSSEFYIDVGPLRRFFTLTTRAPDVNESFNYPNEDDRVPYPDIDTILSAPDHPAQQYIVSNNLNVDDIEIPVEIKTNNSNAQVRIKPSGSLTWGNWTDIRSI